MVLSSTWSIIVTLFNPNLSTLSSRVFLSFSLYSTAITSPSPSSIAASTVISAYKSLFKSTKSPYYVDIEKKPSVDMFTVYNAFTDILTHKDKDICNKADKCLLIKDILGITE